MKRMLTTIVLACLMFPTICLGGSLVTSEAAQKSVVVTPTITAGAYASGDQIGGITKLTGLLDNANKVGSLMSINVVDLDSQNANLQFFFFSQAPTAAAGDNNPFDVSDANMLFAIIAHTVSAYASTLSNTIGSTTVLFSELVSTARDTTNKATGDIYVVVKCNSNVTYTTTSSLQWRFGVWL